MIALFLPRWFMQKIGQQPLRRKSWGGVCELTQLQLAWNAVNKRAALTAPAAEGIYRRLAGRRSFVVYENKFIFIKKCTICHNCKSIKKTTGPAAGSSHSPLRSTQVTCSLLVPWAWPAAAAAAKLKNWGELRLISPLGKSTDLLKHSGPNPSLVWQHWSYIGLNFGRNLCSGFHSNNTVCLSEVRVVKWIRSKETKHWVKPLIPVRSFACSGTGFGWLR